MLPTVLTVVLPRASRVHGRLQATMVDCLPLVNIKPFGVCAVTHGPCLPPALVWTQAHPGGRLVGGALPLLESSVCQCALGGRIHVTVLPVPGGGLAGVAADLKAEWQQQDKDVHDPHASEDVKSHALSGRLQLVSAGVAVVGLGCAVAGFFFPPLAVVGAAVLAVSEVLFVAAVAIDVVVAVRHPTQDNWVRVGQDAVAVAIGYAVGKVLLGPALKALQKGARQLLEREAAETVVLLPKTGQAAEEAIAQQTLEEDLVAASKKRADDLVAERERIKTANEGVKPKRQEPQTVSSPVTASIADPKVIDPVTGKPAIYQGENFNMDTKQGRTDFAKFKEEAHPVLKERIKKQQDLLDSGWKPENPLSGKNPGAHAEVGAFDKALKARKAAGLKVDDNTIDELFLHNRSLLKSQYPNGAPKMCDHCKRILDGIHPIGHE